MKSASERKKLYLIRIKSGPLDYLKQLSWLTKQEVKFYADSNYEITLISEMDESIKARNSAGCNPISSGDILIQMTHIDRYNKRCKKNRNNDEQNARQNPA